MSDNDDDFIQRNGTFLLSVLGIISSILSGCLVYALKSRCTKIECCGAKCEREVIEMKASAVDSSPNV